jgi:hypothetical protein
MSLRFEGTYANAACVSITLASIHRSGFLQLCAMLNPWDVVLSEHHLQFTEIMRALWIAVKQIPSARLPVHAVLRIAHGSSLVR